jgi:predicted MarR family transcription regulator
MSLRNELHVINRRNREKIKNDVTNAMKIEDNIITNTITATFKSTILKTSKIQVTEHESKLISDKVDIK